MSIWSLSNPTLGHAYPGRELPHPPEEALFPENEVETKNTIPSIAEAALALHACVPDGEKVQ